MRLVPGAGVRWDQMLEVGARCIGLVYGGIMYMRLVQGACDWCRVGSCARGVCKVHRTGVWWEHVNDVGARCMGLVYGGIWYTRLVHGIGVGWDQVHEEDTRWGQVHAFGAR